MTTTASARGDLAEHLLPVAAKLACVVHGDGDHHDVAHHVRQLDRDELIGLVVVLAGLVDPDQRIDDAIGYVTWDEEGRPAPALANGKRTLRGLAAGIGGPLIGVDTVLESERIQLARRLFCGEGKSAAEVARMVGSAERTVYQWRDEYGWQQSAEVTYKDMLNARAAAA